MTSGSIDLIVTDPPYNTGHIQTRKRKTNEDYAYEDSFVDFIGFLEQRLRECYRLLKETGSLFIFCDYRESAYIKILLDKIFGRKSFINEIIWSYDYGARSRKKWSCKHDTIYWYAKDPSNYTFNYEEIDRIPYMAPSLCGAEKAKKGKTPTDVWWNTIVSPGGKEATKYPTQKPINILKRIIVVHSNPNEIVLDPFAGSGTSGDAACQLDRSVYLIDKNPDAINIMQSRLTKYQFEYDIKEIRPDA